MSGTEGASTMWRPASGGPASLSVSVTDLSRVGEARRAAETLARSCGLDEQARGRLGIVVTEAATNLARHARDGIALFRDTTPTGLPGVEMLAIDHGPGMNDLSRFFADGYSTGGTAGAGLGAMRRQADELDVYSQPGRGTVVVARVFSTREDDAPPPRLLDMGVVCVPLHGETACGDGWALHQDGERALVLLADGLGHGPTAAEAADTACQAFRGLTDRSPQEVVERIHEALRSTRGAAVAVAEVRRGDEGRTVTFCGVGNTVATIVGAMSARGLPSMNGTAGLSLTAVREFTLPWAPGEQLVMHTDGLTSRWRLDQYHGILGHDPSILAGVLFRDFSRARDDATVLALRWRGAERR